VDSIAQIVVITSLKGGLSLLANLVRFYSRPPRVCWMGRPRVTPCCCNPIVTLSPAAALLRTIIVHRAAPPESYVTIIVTPGKKIIYYLFI
jgi:hypothetical protein